MKCPHHKKNPPDLQTRRTLANGKEVVRDRYCPKCKKYIRTIEKFQTDILKEESLISSRIQGLNDKNQTLRQELGSIKDVWRLLVSFIGCKCPEKSKKKR